MKAVILPLVATLVATSSCRAKEDERSGNRTKVAASSDANATADVADRALGFVLHHPGPGWKLLHRDDAAALCHGAVAAALSPNGLVGVVHVARLEGAIDDHVKATAGRIPLDQREIAIGTKARAEDGASMLYDVKGRLGAAELAYTGKAITRRGLVYDVVAWSTVDAASSEDAKTFLEAFALTDGPPDDAALTSDVAAVPDDDTATVGLDFALRDARYRDYLLALTVAAPEGFSMTAGAEARRVHPDARVVLRDQERGIVALLTGRPAGEGTDQKALHEQLVGAAHRAVAFQPGPAETAKLGDADALSTEGSATIADETTRYRLVSARHADHGIALWIWGTPPAMRAEPARIDALTAGVDLEVTLPAVEATTAAYRDHRLGYTLTTPSGWSREELTPSALERTGTLVRWDNQGRWIAVLAAALPGPAAHHPWMVSFLEQLLRDELGEITRATAVPADDELSGEPAGRVSWHASLQRVDALLARHQGIAYAVLTVDHDATAYELVKTSFAFLP